MDDSTGSASHQNSTLREFFARYVLGQATVSNPSILRAFASVPREIFAGAGPWSVLTNSGYVRTPDNNVAFLYQDTLIALDPNRSINIGEPSLHAKCLDALNCREGDTVIHVGSGSGYYSAVLANIVGESGQIHAYEIDSVLADIARNNLASMPWVKLHAMSGLSDQMPIANGIYVNAGITHPSSNWLKVLRVGGRLLFPLQPIGQRGGMLLIERSENETEWPCRFISPARFVGCIGLQNEKTSKNLEASFSTKELNSVTSIRFGTTPDQTCWCAGDGWWLSHASPEP